jgi:Protein of unknown function (DUF3618)
MGQEPSEIRQEIEHTREQMGDTVDALAYKADVPGRVRESISDKTSRFRQQMSGTASSINESTPDGSDMKEGARQAVGVAQENPLGLAIGGVAVGFLVGMALPATRVENERIGPLADDVKDKAKETGQEALERGKAVAQETAQSAKETARESGQQQAQELSSNVGS